MSLKNFQQVGKDLFLAGLNNSHSGNISIRLGDKMLITRTGAMLHHITESDLIKTSILSEDENIQKASREYPVHKAIYKATNAKAIVHAHSPYLVAQTYNTEKFKPIDAEGNLYFPNGVPVIIKEKTIASYEVGELASEHLKQIPAIIVRSHGVFAIGQSLEEAYKYVCSLEHSAKIKFLNKISQIRN